MNLNGAIIINKPQGITSANVVAKVKRKIFENTENVLIDSAKREKLYIGHAGTLDPMATGVLVVLFGKATRLQDLVMGDDKVYAGTIRLGLKTDTDDITGNVIDNVDCRIQNAESPNIERVLKTQFQGKVSQVPPVVSALKVNGKRAYDLVRDKREFTLRAREIEIFKSEFKFISDNQLVYKIHCSKGTYIRAIARDIGELLGCGATLERIERVRSGRFTVENAQNIENISRDIAQNSSYISFDELIVALPQMEISETEKNELYFGRQDFLQMRYLAMQNSQKCGSGNVVFNLVFKGKSIGLAKCTGDDVLKIQFLNPC